MSKQLRVYREGAKTEFDYQILWEEDFTKLADAVKKLELSCGKICIVADDTVGNLYGKEVQKALEELDVTVDLYTFPAGEASKNLDTVKELYAFLIEHHYTRKDVLAALGGGVTGDLTGYAAATYLRGIDFIQIPTTLLAQVDSSVGGKTGVDFAQYKNQFARGMGEVLKSGLIRDARFYEWTINHMSEIQERIYSVLVKMVRKCCEIKAAVVESDPTEQGERALLILGHTVGHAVEKLKHFELLHGQCVALGTIAAAYISFKRGCLSTEEFYEIRDMNVGFDLPIFFNGLDNEAVLQTTKSDKKMDNGRIKFILLKKIGQAYIDKTVTDEEILDAIQFINGDMIEGE